MKTEAMKKLMGKEIAKETKWTIMTVDKQKILKGSHAYKEFVNLDDFSTDKKELRL